MPQYTRTLWQESTRSADFMDGFREQRRMPHPTPRDKSALPQNNDAAVLLPILLLLMTEGADRFLLFALLYILM